MFSMDAASGNVTGHLISPKDTVQSITSQYVNKT